MNKEIIKFLNVDDKNYLEDILNKGFEKIDFDRLHFFTAKTKHIDFIFGRKEFLTLTFLANKDFLKNYNVISITEPEEEFIDNTVFKYFNNFIKLSFSDINYNLETTNNYFDIKEDIRTISNEQIKLLQQFIISNKDKKFIIHCTVGISRSSAIGLFIEEILNDNPIDIKKNQLLILNHERYCPNEDVVLKTIGKIFEQNNNVCSNNIF